MGTDSKQGWLLFESTNECEKRFPLPLVVEVSRHIGEKPQGPFDRQSSFIQEPTLLYLSLKFFRIVKESSCEIRRVIHQVAMLPISQVTFDNLHEDAIIKESQT